MSVAEKKTLGFKTEVKQLLKLMVHSLYSNKEIFLRELISNSSDAINKLRFEALKNPTIYQEDTEPKLTLTVDKEKRYLILNDNGIGMTREEIITNLGTIAKSGTKEFLASLTGEANKDAQLIGQFGVGFYSVFMVADKVIVKTRSAYVKAEEAVRWESSGDGEFTLEPLTKESRGTEVILHLKESASEFLDNWRLKAIIKKYSDHITLPITMKKETTSSDASEDKTTQATEWETVNNTTALWALPKTQISEEQYKEFYKYLTHDFQEPLAWIHNKIEGKTEYTTLLYIPSQAPFDLWNYEKPRGLKLYIKRTFIMDDAEQFLPRYLRFVKGIVDCDDLPLNISREILQNNKQVDKIKTAITKRILESFTHLSKEQPEKYKLLWQAFGNVLKEGLAEDFANRNLLAKLLRFSSTKVNSKEQSVSLETYIERMKPKQEKIYYIIAENYAAASHSPNLEIFCKKEIEVLLLYDRIDEWLIAHLTEFEGKPLQSITKDSDMTEISEGENLEQEKIKQNQDEFGPLLKQIKEILLDKVSEVRVSQRLTSSPSCIVSEKNALSGQMQRILQATGQSVPTSKPILELNTDHKLIKRLKNEQDDTQLSEWAHLFFEQAVLAEEGHAEFVKRSNNLLNHFVK